MGTVHKFRRRPNNEKQFGGYRPPGNWRPRRRPSSPKRKHWWGPTQALLLVLGVSSGALIALATLTRFGPSADAAAFECSSPRIIDGDTIHCGDRKVRLYGIDAPELPGHCRPGRKCTPGDPYASTANLERLAGSGSLQCAERDTDAYGRTVARCQAGGTDLSCGQINGGFAARRYGVIWC